MDVLKREDWTGNVTNELRNFEQTLIIALKQKGMCGTLYLLKYANVFYIIVMYLQNVMQTHF